MTNRPTPATPTPDRCAQVAQVHRGPVAQFNSGDGSLVVEWCEHCGAMRDGGTVNGRVRWNAWAFPQAAQ